MSKFWYLVETLKLVLGWDFEDVWSRFVWEFVIWPKEVTLVSRTQPSGPLCLWQCFCYKLGCLLLLLLIRGKNITIINQNIFYWVCGKTQVFYFLSLLSIYRWIYETLVVEFLTHQKQLFSVGREWSDDHDCTLSWRGDRYIISKSQSTI